MLLGEIIKQYRKEHDMSLQDFANLMGTSKSYIHMLERNLNPSTNKPINPSIETLKTLSSVMNIDLDLLLKSLNSNQEIYLNEEEFKKQFEQSPNFSSLPLKEKLIAEGTYNVMHTASVITIPLLGTVKAGYDYLANENIIDYIPVTDSSLDNENFFALKVKGDSMVPEIYEGDIAIVKKQDNFENGDYVVALINGDEATIKKGFKSDTGLLLQPVNTSIPPLIFDEETIKSMPVKIIGVVYNITRSFK